MSHLSRVRKKLTVLSAAVAFAALTPVAIAEALIPVSAASPTDFRKAAEDFIAAAHAADLERLMRAISPAVIRRSGPSRVESYLSMDVRSFFADFHKVASTVSVTRVSDAHGLNFFMFKETRDGRLEPFFIQVVQEGSSLAVSNIIVDRFIEGRHCRRASGTWQCPDVR